VNAAALHWQLIIFYLLIKFKLISSSCNYRLLNTYLRVGLWSCRSLEFASAVHSPVSREGVQELQNSQQEAKEQLDKVIKQEIRDGFPIKQLISDRDPVEEIVRVVSEEKIDLIVMLAHEEGHLGGRKRCHNPQDALFGPAGENGA
jgi:nucleotide-binding universal stress UspA family protein